MQHDNFQKKTVQTPGVKGLYKGKIFACTCCIFSSFNLISNMTIFQKIVFWPRSPTLKVHPVDRTQTFKLKSCLIVSYLLLMCLHAKLWLKILTADFVNANFTFDPRLKGQVVLVNFLMLLSISTGTAQS